jgi:uncharacterized protein (DUF4213/DUF364 family)
MFYQELHKKFLSVLKESNLLDKRITVETRILKPTDAIGQPDREDFPLLKGKEVLMQATFMGSQGQAYTDAPSKFSGTVREIMDLSLNDSRQRALFIASVNAVMRYLAPDIKTVHCKNNEPDECAREIMAFLRSKKRDSVGLIGLQPAILEAAVETLGAERVICIDRDQENRGQVKHGVPIKWGDHEGMEEVFKKCDVVLVTGSTIVNGSLPDILQLGRRFNRPVYFYGTTIAGATQLMGLNRLCYRPS